jgi:thiosulfate dehydrogenase [quinone] large subunit
MSFSSAHWAFFLARTAVAMSMFGHGLVRLPKLEGFSNWMLSKFENTMLPASLVIPFSYALPIAEFLTGILLLAGLLTRQALIAGAFIMILLIFGSSMQEDWGAIPSQLLHTAFFCTLLCFTDSHNLISLDSKRKV